MLKNSRWLKPTFVLAAGMLPTGVYAQGMLEEVVVTAQKREQSLQDVPISVSVLSGESLSESKIDTTVDLALSTPSLNFQGGFAPHAGSFAIRGIGTFALEGGIQPSVSFVVDGVPIARVGEFSADMADIERVEILRGPQGTLFGRNATAGAINLVRKKPTDEFESYAAGSITDDNEYIVKLGVNGAISDSVNGRLSGYWKEYDGFLDNIYTGEDEGDEESWGAVGKLDFMLSPDANLLLTGDYRKTDTSNSPSVVTKVEDGPIGALRLSVLGDGDPAKGQKLINDPFKINNSFRQLANSEAWGGSADLTWDLGDDITLKSISAYRSYEVEMGIDVDATPSNAANPLMPVTGVEWTNFNPNGYSNPPLHFDTDYLSQELRLEGKTGDVEWIGGIYYSDYTDKPANEVPLLFDCTVLDPSGALCGLTPGLLQSDAHTAKATWESAAIFGDATWYLSDSFNVFAGLRFTWEDVDLDYDRTDRRVAAVPDSAWYQVLTPSKVFIDPDACAPLFVTVGLCSATQTKFSRSENSDDWSGRIGAAWDLSDSQNVYVSASRGFVGAGVNFGRTATYENSMLDPSISVSYEVGTKSTFFDNSVRLNGAIFWQEIEDIQTSALVPGTVVTETFNAGDVTSYGMEADLTWAATDNLILDLKMTYLDTELSDLEQACYPGQTEAQGCNINPGPDGVFRGQSVDGKSAVQAPEWSYRASARYEMPLASMPFDLFGVASYTWQDDVQFKLTHDPLTKMDAYGLLDVTIGLQDKQGRYDVSIFGKNITDELFYLNMDATEVVIGRQYVRMSRQAEAYWGIQARYNFF